MAPAFYELHPAYIAWCLADDIQRRAHVAGGRAARRLWRRAYSIKRQTQSEARAAILNWRGC